MQNAAALTGDAQLRLWLEKAKALVIANSDLLALVIVIWSTVLRFHHAGHIVSGDDADNFLQVKRLLAGKPLDQLQLKHPPLYILLNAAVAAVFGLKAINLIYFNIFIAVLALAVLYIVAKRWFGTLSALSAMLFLALMPNNIFFSTWIKQDILLSLLTLATLAFWIRRDFTLAGIALGAALLVKENALIVIFVMAVDLLWRRDVKYLKGFGMLCLTATIVSGWWYGYYMSEIFHASGGRLMNVVGLVRGTKGFGEALKNTPWYYLQRLGLDVSYSLIPFIALGLAVPSSWRGEKKRLLVFWLLSGYLVSSIAAAKISWFISPYMIPAAAVGAFGLRVMARKVDIIISAIVAAIAAVFAIALLYGFSYNTYSAVSGYPTFYSYAFQMTGKGLQVRMKPGQRVAAPFKEALLLYFAPIEDEDLFLLPDSKSDIKTFIRKNRIDYIVLWYSSTFFDVKDVFKVQRQISKLVPDDDWITVWGYASIVPTTRVWHRAQGADYLVD